MRYLMMLLFAFVGCADPVSQSKSQSTPPDVADFDDYVGYVHKELASIAPEGWETSAPIRVSAPGGRNRSGGGLFAVKIVFANQSGEEMPSFGGKGKIFLDVAPNGFRWRSELDPSNDPLSTKAVHPAAFLGANERASFYYDRYARRDDWKTFKDDAVRKLGLHGRHSTFEFLRFELHHGQHDLSLFERIRERPESERLDLAEGLVKKLREVKDRWVFQFWLIALSKLTDQHLEYFGHTAGEKHGESFEALAKKWDRWIEWARKHDESEWMKRAFRDNVAMVGLDNLWIAQKAVWYLEERTGHDYGGVRLVSDEERANCIRQWADWLKRVEKAMRWDREAKRMIFE